MIDIGRDDRVHRHAEQRGVGKCDYENTPKTQMVQQSPDPCGVPRQNVSDGFQRKFSLREKLRGIHMIETIGAPAQAFVRR